MEFRKKKHRQIKLDVTPLIDVVFLLLIFFMISTTFITNPGINVRLPLAASKAKLENKPIEIVITQDNRIFLDGKLINLADLRPVFEKKAATGMEKVLLLKADGRVEHRVVVNVLDIAKQAGIRKLSIATEPKRN